MSSFTWAVCLLKDSPCRHTLDLNRDGCHVDSWQPGTFCSVLIHALVFFLCAFSFDKQTSQKTRGHYIKAFISQREDFSWDLSCSVMPTTFDFHLMPWCLTAVITMHSAARCSLCCVLCAMFKTEIRVVSIDCRFVTGTSVLSTGFAGEGRLHPSASVAGHVWMEAHLRAANSCNQN